MSRSAHFHRRACSRPDGRYSGEWADEPLLTAEQERELARAVARGDHSARDRLTRANLRLVVAIGRSYEGRGLSLEDLIGEGNIGLLRAVSEFDPAHGVRFSTYAAYWIKEAIRSALTNYSRTVRVPSHMVRLLSEWGRTERQLARDGETFPSFELIAGRLGLSLRRRELVKDARRAGVNNQGLVGQERLAEAKCPSDPPEAVLDRADAVRDLRTRMAERLTETEFELITLRFGLGDGDPMTLREVGARMGRTREWARCMEIRAVAKLRDRAGE